MTVVFGYLKTWAIRLSHPISRCLSLAIPRPTILLQSRTRAEAYVMLPTNLTISACAVQYAFWPSVQACCQQ